MRFVNKTGGTVELPTLGLRVPDGEEFDATGQDAKNLEAAGFERTDKPASKSDKEQ